MNICCMSLASSLQKKLSYVYMISQGTWALPEITGYNCFTAQLTIIEVFLFFKFLMRRRLHLVAQTVLVNTQTWLIPACAINTAMTQYAEASIAT